ncbi:MAG: glycosyltransferase family 39 protein [bacterium]|nr:glycosyltransferase family 39 protein [bacterium]
MDIFLNTLLSRRILVIAFMLICGLGFSDFYTRGEAREALVVQAMVAEHEYVLPRGYADLIPSKPPVFHWLGALTSHLMGRVNEFTIRLPSALASLGTLVFFLVCLHKYLTTRTSLLFTLFLMFSFEWLRAGVSARVDMVHAAFMSCGLLSSFLVFETKAPRYWILMIAFFTLATLSKGPVGIAIPSLVLITWIYLTQKGSQRFGLAVKVGSTVMLSLALSLTWYLTAYFQAPTEFANKVWYENVLRFTSSTHDQPHAHSIFYLIAVLFLGLMPWSPIVCWVAIKCRARSLKDLKDRWSSASNLQKFSFITTSIIILFYCIPSSKRGVYLLAAYPFIAYLSAFLIDSQMKLSNALVNNLFKASVIFTLLAQLFIIPNFIAPRSSEKTVAQTLVSLANTEPIYSFGFDFFGASFYAKKKFHKLEEYLLNPSAYSSAPFNVVYFSEQSAQLQDAIEKLNLNLQINAEIPLKKDSVKIARVSLKKIEDPKIP